MHDRYERFFDPQLLLWVNVAIIMVAETLGRGRLFYDTGLIHVPVLLFVLLVGTRIFGRYSLYDPVMRRFLGWSLGAVAILLASYAIEFADQDLGRRLPPSAVYGGIISFHLVALLAISVGAFHLLRAHGRMRYATFWLAASALVGVVSFAASFAAYAGVIPAVPPVLYVMIAAVAGLATAMPTMAIGRLAPALKEFSQYLGATLTFITAAAGASAVHLVAKGEYVVYQQATYVGNFAFFGAMSFLFLAFGKFANPGGVYKAAQPANGVKPPRTERAAKAPEKP